MRAWVQADSAPSGASHARASSVPRTAETRRRSAASLPTRGPVQQKPGWRRAPRPAPERLQHGVSRRHARRLQHDQRLPGLGVLRPRRCRCRRRDGRRGRVGLRLNDGARSDASSLAAVLLTAAARCSTSSGFGGADAAAEAAGVSDDAQGGAAGDDASGAAACAAADGQCEVGAFCEEVASWLAGQSGRSAAFTCSARLTRRSSSFKRRTTTSRAPSIRTASRSTSATPARARSAAGARWVRSINKAAKPQYTADVANGPQVACSWKPPPPVSEGAEPVEPVACCVGGQCQAAAGQCALPMDADGGADVADTGVGDAGDGGPADASDE
jgi:hypothetical protein